MTSPFLGEFLGTAVLILLGNGVVAGVVLKRSKAEASGWIVITAGWALAVMAGVFTSIACGSSDAHLNPAVTLGFAFRTGDFSKVIPYIAAQLLGAIVGAILVWITTCRIGKKRRMLRGNWLASAQPRRFEAMGPI